METALTPAQLLCGYDLPEIAEQELEKYMRKLMCIRECDTCKR